jgi:hypothetical protein
MRRKPIMVVNNGVDNLYRCAQRAATGSKVSLHNQIHFFFNLLLNEPTTSRASPLHCLFHLVFPHQSRLSEMRTSFEIISFQKSQKNICKREKGFYDTTTTTKWLLRCQRESESRARNIWWNSVHKTARLRLPFGRTAKNVGRGWAQTATIPSHIVCL